MSTPPPIPPAAIRTVPRAPVPAPSRSHVVDTAAIVCLAIITCVALVSRNETIAVVALTSILPVVGLRVKAPDGAKPGAGGSGALAMVAAFGAGLAFIAGRGRA
jgi:hypothetical protein